MGATVVLISFGTAYWARVWMEETGSPVPVLLDPTRAAYRSYGLERSWLRSWSLPTLWYYGKALMRGEKLGGKRGDTEQLGGNFIVDERGVVQFAHPSRDPTDRPDVDTLITVLRGCA